MKKILDDLKKAIENGTYYSALALALSLPDICSQVEYSCSSSRSHYIKWVNAHMEEDFFKVGLSGFKDVEFRGEMCYALRCQFLHSSDSNINASPIIEDFKILRSKSNWEYRCILVSPNSIVSSISKEINGWQYEVNEKIQVLKIKLDIKYLCESLYKIIFDFYSNKSYTSKLDKRTQDLLF